MAFTDPRYFLFFAAAALLLGALSRETAKLVILAVFNVSFMVLLGQWWWLPFVIFFISYVGALAIIRMREDLRFYGLIVCLCLCLLPLISFKYIDTAYSLFSELGISTENWTGKGLILPIGISFYTFAAAGYIIDVFVEKIDVERNILRFFTFVTFFPNFASGPIERAGHFLPQVSQVGQFNYPRAVSGLRAILYGLFLKIAIADSLAPYVNETYTNISEKSGIDLALATLYFAFQVYTDFAGYSLVAIGSARLLGIELLPNFRQPYLSATVADFWRRWHISLSSWFRDYVFMPLFLQGRGFGQAGMAGALITSFVLVGVWHGAGLKFALFGLIHGTLVTISTLTLRARDGFWKRRGVPAGIVTALRIPVTFFTVYVTLVLFRADSMADATVIYQKFLEVPSGGRTVPVGIPLLLIAAVLACDVFSARAINLQRFPVAVRWAGYYAGIFLVLSAALSQAYLDSYYANQFIYFKF